VWDIDSFHTMVRLSNDDRFCCASRRPCALAFWYLPRARQSRHTPLPLERALACAVHVRRLGLTNSPGRFCHSTLSLAVIGRHSLGIYILILLPLLSFSAKMTVLPGLLTKPRLRLCPVPPHRG
jgi:hypothetical protein